MITRTEGGVTYTQNFDAENRLTSIIPTTGVAASFKYDGDGNLIAKLSGTVATYYIGGVYEVEVTNTTITKKTWYYPAGGAIRVEDLVNSANSGVFYILKDHLGSASVTLNSSGNSIAESRYYPFGETRVTSGTIPTDKRFQSQRDVGLGGLMHFGARFYHPKLGRFISADTIVPNFADPQNLNRYAFVLNNPLKYIDPTGHSSVCGSAYSDPECNSPSNDPVIYSDVYTGGGLEPEEVIFQNSSNGGTSVGGGDFCSQHPVECQFETKPSIGGDATTVITSTTTIITTTTITTTTTTTNYSSGVCGGLSVCISFPAPSGPLWGFHNKAAEKFFGDMSNFMDQMAFIIGIANPVIDLAACAIFSEIGCLEVAAIVHEDVQIFEAGVSWTSTGLTALSDISGGRTGFDPNTLALVVGQDTVFSTITSTAGMIVQDPVTDTLVNSSQLAYDGVRANGASGTDWAVVIPLLPGFRR